MIPSLCLLSLYFYLQALMDSNLPRLQLELYKEIKKVRKDVCIFCTCYCSGFIYMEIQKLCKVAVSFMGNLPFLECLY